jgi:hypothetical protein
VRQRRAEQTPSVPLLPGGRMHERGAHAPERLDYQGALFPCARCARLTACRINRGPPFSPLCTLWLAMRPALAGAVGCACSRHRP